MRLRKAPLLCIFLIGLVALASAVVRTDPSAQRKGTGSKHAGPGEPITVCAAAGVRNVFTEIAEEYERTRGIPIRFNFAASSTLARQIEAGAPAEVFISANARWMDYLEHARLIQTETRRDLLATRLVLIAPKGRAFHVKMTADFNLPQAFAGRLALGDPDHVPAGLYAREALEYLGWYEALESRFLPGLTVRAALAEVELKEAGAGIVYATDAMASDKVELLAVFPAESHEPIRFPAALCRGASAAAVEFHEHLYGLEAAAVFRRHGFTPLASTEGPDDAPCP